MSEYQPIPVTAARAVAHQFAKDIVVILAIDHAHGRTHFTSYGKSPEDKIAAGNLADRLPTLLGVPQDHTTNYEDFRLREAAEWAQQKDQYARRIEILTQRFQEFARGFGGHAESDCLDVLEEIEAASPIPTAPGEVG